MPTYNISNGTTTYTRFFNDLISAEAWRDSNAPGFIITETTAEDAEPTRRDRLEQDRNFGARLIDNFLADYRSNFINKGEGTPQTHANIVLLLAKLDILFDMLQQGWIVQAQTEVAALTLAPAYFTAGNRNFLQNRIDNYLLGFTQ